MKICAISRAPKGVGPEFGSKIIFENSKAPLTEAQRAYIDKFDDGLISDAKFLGEGVTAKAYYSKKMGFVIKAHKPNPYLKNLGKEEIGSLNYENKMLMAIQPNVKTTQRSVGYVETANEGHYLLSTFVNGKPADIKKNPFRRKHIDRLLRNLDRLDRSNIIHSDLSRPNLLLTSNFDVNIIDYQWAEIFYMEQRFSDYGIKNAFFPYFDIPNNASMFEAAALPGYLKEMPPDDAEDFLHNYLENKAYYTAKKQSRFEEYFSKIGVNCSSALVFEKAKTKAYSALDPSILAAEVLKMNILNLHRRQYTCYDRNKIEPRNIHRAIPLMLEAKKCAVALSLIRPKYSQDADYFYYMNEYGKYWQNKMQDWYADAINWFYRLVTKKEKESWKILFPEKYNDFSGLDIVKISSGLTNNFLKSMFELLGGENEWKKASDNLLEIFKFSNNSPSMYNACKDNVQRIVSNAFRIIV